MPFAVRPATEADAPKIAALGREAFRDGIGQLLYPPRFSHRTVENTPPDAEGGPFMDETTWQLQRNLGRIRTMMTVVAVESSSSSANDRPEGSGEKEEILLGYAHWEAPEGSPYFKGPADGVLKEDRPAPVAPTFDRERAKQIEEQSELETKKVLGEDGYKDMWYLAVLCVHPKHQGKGIGKKLLQWGMARAAEEQKALFLLASTEGFPLYRSQGFQTVGEFQLAGVLQSRAMILPAPFPTLDPATVLGTDVLDGGALPV